MSDDAQERDAALAALRAVWADMRGLDKHYVPNDVLALVRAAIGDELDHHDPASRSKGV